MSKLSDDFHAAEDAVKNEVNAILGRVENGADTALKDLETVGGQLINQAGPLIVDAGLTAVTTALSGGGTASAVIAAAEGIAKSKLASAGVTLADSALVSLKAVILAGWAKSAGAVTPAS